MFAQKRPHVPGSLTGEIMLRDAQDVDRRDLLILWQELMDAHTQIDARFELAADSDRRFESYIDNAMERDDYRVRLALLAHRPVGFAVSCILPNSPMYRAQWIGYINDICVTESVRRRGVGECLVQDAVQWLRASGAESVEVYVAHANEAAQRFWRRVGAQDYLQRLSLNIAYFDGSRD